jgi:hypothetical protein
VCRRRVVVAEARLGGGEVDERASDLVVVAPIRALEDREPLGAGVAGIGPPSKVEVDMGQPHDRVGQLRIVVGAVGALDRDRELVALDRAGVVARFAGDVALRRGDEGDVEVLIAERAARVHLGGVELVPRFGVALESAQRDPGVGQRESDVEPMLAVERGPRAVCFVERVERGGVISAPAADVATGVRDHPREASIAGHARGVRARNVEPSRRLVAAAVGVCLAPRDQARGLGGAELVGAGDRVAVRGLEEGHGVAVGGEREADPPGDQLRLGGERDVAELGRARDQRRDARARVGVVAEQVVELHAVEVRAEVGERRELRRVGRRRGPRAQRRGVAARLDRRQAADRHHRGVGELAAGPHQPLGQQLDEVPAMVEALASPLVVGVGLLVVDLGRDTRRADHLAPPLEVVA